MMLECGRHLLVALQLGVLGGFLRGAPCRGSAGLVVQPGCAAEERCSACLQCCMVRAVAAVVSAPDALLHAVEGTADPNAAGAAREGQSEVLGWG